MVRLWQRLAAAGSAVCTLARKMVDVVVVDAMLSMLVVLPWWSWLWW